MNNSTDQSIIASVVIPVRNRPDLLRQALESLRMQDIGSEKFEIIVCDDGSTDDISSVVGDFNNSDLKITIEHQEPKGPAAARNAGIRASQSAYIVFVDSDVVVAPDMVRLLVEALEREPTWAGAEACLLPSGGNEGLLWDAPSSKDGGRFHTAAIAYRRTVLIAVGGLDESFKLPACEDVELAIRVLQHGSIGFVPKAIAHHPRRRINAVTHWKWRRHWRYETILAVRYGILSFPNRSAGQYPRLRVLFAAVISLPAGRLFTALGSLRRSPLDASLAAAYSLFDIICGTISTPDILLERVPPRLDYISAQNIEESP